MNMAPILVILAVVLIVLFTVWATRVRRDFAELRHQVAGAWKQVELQLARRRDLVPVLAQAAAALGIDGGAIDELLAARDAADALAGTGRVERTAHAEHRLGVAIANLVAALDAGGRDTARTLPASIREELTSVENKVAFARQLYNDTASLYESRRRQPSPRLLAHAGHTPRAEPWGDDERATLGA